MSKKLAAMIRSSQATVQSGMVSPDDDSSSAEPTATTIAASTKTAKLPSSTSAAPKCTACAKTVYKPEETVAVGRIWHSACFVCGGTKSDENGGCRRVLKRDGYIDHDNQPFCNSCHGKLFGPRGYRGSVSAVINSYTSTAEINDSYKMSVDDISKTCATVVSHNSEVSVPAVTEKINILSLDSGSENPLEEELPVVNAPSKKVSGSAKVAAMIRNSQPSDQSGIAPHEQIKRLACSSSECHEKDNISFSAEPTATTIAASTKTAKLPSSTSAAPKCTACAKTVYKPEETVAVGRIWHSACFVCGGTKSDENGGCRRVLKRDGYIDHDNQPFCNSCHGKLFGPKGYRGAVSASINSYVTEPRNEIVSNVSSLPVPPVADSGTSAATKIPPSRTSIVPSTRANVNIPQRLSGSVADSHNVASTSAEASKLIGKTVTVGSSKADSLHKEASYSGEGDEVADDEW